MPIVPVILCGGSGTRLWPMSRETYPKPFLRPFSTESLLQRTLLRLGECAPPLVLSNQETRFLLAEEFQRMGITPGRLILEPVARNTAPAIAVAALFARLADENAVILVLPSDHVIQNEVAFRALLPLAEAAAQSGKLVTFGIVPNSPHTGYGYIQRGQPLGPGLFAVSAFVEKPDAVRAAQYVESGNYAWNSGMFMFRADVLLAELKRYQPQMLAAAEAAVATAKTDLDFTRLNEEAFAACPSDSIDYALMEKTDAAVVLEADIGWSDVGSWSAMRDVSTQDANGNATTGDVLLQDSQDNLVQADSRLVALLGVRNLAVVETADAVLVADMDHADNVKKIVAHLKQAGRSEADWHRKVYRPWGSYESVDAGARFQVKRIVVKPGGRLSLQKHVHRAEHWVVVSGTAEVTCGDKVFLLCENQSTFIPLGEKHRLANPGKVPLEIIEIQSGAYLGEDDIERFDDIYGRDKA